MVNLPLEKVPLPKKLGQPLYGENPSMERGCPLCGPGPSGRYFLIMLGL